MSIKEIIKITLTLVFALVIAGLLISSYQGSHGIDLSLRGAILIWSTICCAFLFWLYAETENNLFQFITYLGLVLLGVNSGISLYNEDFTRQLALDPKISISLKRYDEDREKHAKMEKKYYQLQVEAENEDAQFYLEKVWVNPTIRYYDSTQRSLRKEKILEDPRLFTINDFEKSKRNKYIVKKLKVVLCSDPSIKTYCKKTSMEIVGLWVKLEYRIGSAHRKPQKIGENRFVIPGHKIFVD